MPKNKSIVHQVQDILNQKLRIGNKRHIAKQQGVASEGIHSWYTYMTYLAKSTAFVKWAKENYGCKTVAEARSYVNAYLQHYIDRNYSPWTQKTISNSLAKLYGCSTKDFIPTQSRHRENIKRSRMGKAKFAEDKNRELVDFCKATGLRRQELKQLKPEHLRYDETTKRYYIDGVKGKGGRLSNNPVLSKEAVERIQNTPAGQCVWNKVPSRAGIHSYRANYAKSVYALYARPVADIPKSDRYNCRDDLKGVVYDKRAMAIASRALGHNRISVIAGHYLYATE